MRVASPAVLEVLRAEYTKVVHNAEQELQELVVSSQESQKRDTHRIRRHLLEVERDRVMQALHHGALGRASSERLLADIDARRLALETGKETPPSSSDSSMPARPVADESTEPQQRS